MSRYLNKYFFTGAVIGGGSMYLYQQKQEKRRLDLWASAYRNDNEDVSTAIKNRAERLNRDFKSDATEAFDKTMASINDATDVAVMKTTSAKDSLVYGVYWVKNAVVHPSAYT